MFGGLGLRSLGLGVSRFRLALEWLLRTHVRVLQGEGGLGLHGLARSEDFGALGFRVGESRLRLGFRV